MNRKKEIIFTTLCILCFLSTVSCHKKARTNEIPSKPSVPLTLIMESDKSLYCVGDDILITVGFGYWDSYTDCKSLKLSLEPGEFEVNGDSSNQIDITDDTYQCNPDSTLESTESITFQLDSSSSSLTSGEIIAKLYSYNSNEEEQYYKSWTLYYACDQQKIAIDKNCVEDAIAALP